MSKIKNMKATLDAANAYADAVEQDKRTFIADRELIVLATKSNLCIWMGTIFTILIAILTPSNLLGIVVLIVGAVLTYYFYRFYDKKTKEKLKELN